MKTTEAAKGRWPEIFEHYGLPPVTGGRHFKAECPLCATRGSFRIDDQDGNGTWICKCGSGNGISLVVQTQGKSFAEVCREIDALLGNDYRHRATPINTTATSLRQRVVSKFSKLEGPRGTSAAQYLLNRGITKLPAEAVRFCPKERYQGHVYQSLYSLATDNRGELCYLHRTYLDGDKKAPMGDGQKRLYSLQEDSYLDHAQSVAVRMFPVASTLGIAEGIETALSAVQLYGCNTWATLNSGFMKKFRSPAGVRHLIIFADMDPHSATGHAAAFECAHANLLAKNDIEKVSVRWCDNGDFNDLLVNGDQVREMTFLKKAAA
ncbi:toprim domain-containing protein [Atlantibacter subterranea]|uniref:Toprim domain-containing protein n=1 Tax=Atlantibacter subterraneus TaxID=255519 RepID=A0ABU4E7X6_9ENTR|nr:toprim domain-containing protein [Atlantibacter subterranea]MDV7025244.1 toprim domain-containing protein [Atlantibacter subterranea]MDZ5668382.1 toprim domain-containing protein [Atlantibacter hermannii]